VSVLIADFANGTGDPAFSGVLEQSLGVGVEAASFITAYDRRGALRVAGQLNAGKVLDDNVSRLVAQREGVKVVLAGTIAQDGSGYKLSVRGVNPADGKDILTTEARARNKDDVLNAVPRLARDLSALSEEKLEPIEGFLLSRINGVWTVRSILQLCPVPEGEARQVLDRLVARGLVVLRTGSII